MTKILTPKNLVHQAPDEMHIFIADLHEYGAGFSEKFAGCNQAIAQIGKVGMDTELPGIAESADLFGLAGDIFGATFAHTVFARADLPIGTKSDAVGRVNVDHLHAAFETLFFCQTVHNEERIAQNEAVGPVGLAFGVMAIKVQFACKVVIF